MSEILSEGFFNIISEVSHLMDELNNQEKEKGRAEAIASRQLMKRSTRMPLRRIPNDDFELFEFDGQV